MSIIQEQQKEKDSEIENENIEDPYYHKLENHNQEKIDIYFGNKHSSKEVKSSKVKIG